MIHERHVVGLLFDKNEAPGLNVSQTHEINICISGFTIAFYYIYIYIYI